ncbi:hypothetical protein [Marinobacterium aestuariivivens]
MFESPLLEGGIVGIGLGLFQQMTDTPADGVAIGRPDKALPF